MESSGVVGRIQNDLLKLHQKNSSIVFIELHERKVRLGISLEGEKSWEGVGCLALV